MSIDKQRLRELRYRVRDAEEALAKEVARQVPVGTRVDYQHGDHWIGPYEVTCVMAPPHDAGYLGIRNLKTGKRRRVWVHCVRLTEEDEP